MPFAEKLDFASADPESTASGSCAPAEFDSSEQGFAGAQEPAAAIVVEPAAANVPVQRMVEVASSESTVLTLRTSQALHASSPVVAIEAGAAPTADPASSSSCDSTATETSRDGAQHDAYSSCVLDRAPRGSVGGTVAAAVRTGAERAILLLHCQWSGCHCAPHHVPPPHPPRVLALSLPTSGSCPPSWQEPRLSALLTAHASTAASHLCRGEP